MKGEKIVATWSGGIDSTAVIANLLVRGWDVTALTLTFGGSKFQERERNARLALAPHLEALSGTFQRRSAEAPWLWAFSPDGVEIPTRNRRIIDHMIAVYCEPAGIRNIGMGEYIGCDTWVVRDHVGAADCDARALTAYVYEQYGLSYRLVTLADFGESRYKSDRLNLLYDAVTPKVAALTTNCLSDTLTHCGQCYKCVERAAAFDVNNVHDSTDYMADPRDHDHYVAYFQQMLGDNVRVAAADFVGP